MSPSTPYLIGIRLDPDCAEPTFLAVLVTDNCRPLLWQGKVVLFRDADRLVISKKMASLGLPAAWILQAEMDSLCDIAQSLFVVENCDFDESASVINCLNVVLDMVKLTRGEIPATYREGLLGLADHCTFSRSIKDFFDRSSVSRTDVIDGILWCLGWIFSHSNLVHSSDDTEIPPVEPTFSV